MGKTSRLVSLAVLFSTLGFSFLSALAEEKPKSLPSPPPYRELWVPADQLESVLAKLPRAVMLAPEQYRTLLRDAEKRPLDEAVKAPAAATVREVAWKGELADDVARIVAHYTVVSFTDDWSEIPLTLPRTRLAHIEVNDQTALRVAPPPKGKNPRPVLLVRGRGEHRVAAEYHLPVTRSPSGNAIALASPMAASASLELKYPRDVKLESDLPFVLDEKEPGLARFTLPVKTGKTYQVRWTARDIAGIPDAAVFQTCSYLYSIDSSRVQADLGMILSSSLLDLPGRFEITVPEGVRVLSVEGSELLSWTRKDERTLMAVLTGGKRRATDLRLLAERDVAGAVGGDVTVALPVAEVSGVHRASGTMALIGGEDVRVKNIATGPLTIADPDALESAITGHPNFVAGFRFPVSTTPPEVTLSPVRDRFNAQLDTQISLRREAIYLNRDLVFVPLEGHLFEAELELPAGEELLRVTASGDGADGFSWNREGDSRQVRLHWQQGLASGNSPAVRIETRRDPEGWFELGAEPVALAFANLAVADAETVSGYVAVAFDDSFQVETVHADNLETRDGRTTPVAGKLAWFRLSDYSLGLNASRRVTELEAGITAYALPLQSTLEVEGQLELDIRYTPISELVVKLDPAAGEALRFDSPLLAEKRYDAESGQWTLTFHNELSGRQNFRFRMSLPFGDEEIDEASEQKRFSVDAPALSVPAAKRVRGTWVIEANTDTELSFENDGLDTIDSLRVPVVSGYQPRHRVIAAFQYRGDAWRLRIDGTRHAPEELVTTVVDSLRIDTVVSTDGDDRHQALLNLRTSGEQFLEVSLPKDAVLWTLTVDGAAVKPVRAEEETLRIQLPARPGQRQQSVIRLKMVYQTPGREWGGSGREALEPIRLADRIPVMRTDWLLHLPEGFDYQKFRSNLKEKFEVIDRTLLGQAWETADWDWGVRRPAPAQIVDRPPSGGLPGTARYVFRLDERVKKADDAALRGAQLLADGDSEGAITEFQSALDFLPDAPMTRDRRDAYAKQYANASVKLARQRADEANYDEAISLVQKVMAPGVAPDNPEAKALLEQLNDPEYYSPALTPEHLERVRQVERGLKVARGYRDIGDFDGADREYWAVLNKDPYNQAARRSLEEVERERMDYFDVARNHTRAEFLRKVAEGWEAPVPQPGNEAAASGLGFDVESRGIQAIERKLKTIILPSVEFVNTPLRDCFDFLRQKAQELDTDPDPMNRGIDIVLNTPGSAADTPITLKLTNVPWVEALKYTVSLAQLKYKVEPNAVVVLPISSPDSELLANNYAVPPTFLSAGAGGGGGAAADPFAGPVDSGEAGAARQKKTAKEVLEEFGVVFGPGATAHFDPQSGQLIVKNSQDQMELVEAVIGSLRSSGAPSEADLLVDTTSGEQVMIGGGFQGEDKVPFLGDLPAVGRLFQSGNGLTTPEVDQQMREIRIPELKLENTPLPEAVRRLEEEVAKLGDWGRDAGGGGAQAALPPFELKLDGVDENKKVSLDLSNMPLAEAITRITGATQTRYQVTASGILITPPDAVPTSDLKSLVLELPNASFETSDGNGGIRRMSARNVLTQAGVQFPPGTSAAYNFTTRRLAVRNTQQNLDQVQAHFAAAQSPQRGSVQTLALNDSDEIFQRDFLGGARNLRGFDFRNAGLIPLDFELPKSGRSYAFEGLYAPEKIRFRYVNWDRQVRMAWWWILVGGLAFWFGPWRRWRKPIRLGVLGAVMLTFVPLVISKSLLAFCNSLLIGWLAAMVLWVIWRVCDRVTRKGKEEKPETAVETIAS